MALFVGSHLNKIDKKGRVSVPKPFRAALQSVGSQVLYLYPLFKVPAIEACDESFMSRLSASLDDLDMFSDEQDDLAASGSSVEFVGRPCALGGGECCAERHDGGTARRDAALCA